MKLLKKKVEEDVKEKEVNKGENSLKGVELDYGQIKDYIRDIQSKTGINYQEIRWII